MITIYSLVPDPRDFIQIRYAEYCKQKGVEFCYQVVYIGCRTKPAKREITKGITCYDITAKTEYRPAYGGWDLH